MHQAPDELTFNKEIIVISSRKQKQANTTKHSLSTALF
jgi:hypothetical protein